MVRHSMDQLKSATVALSSAPRVAGTAWSVDYRSNQVVVQGDSSVSASDWSRMTRLAHDTGDFVRMERTEGRFTTRVNGAQPVISASGRCSAGYNVTNGQSEFILTAGHCGPGGTLWFSDSTGRTVVGRTVTSEFPGSGDFSLIRYENGQETPGANVVAIGDGRGVRIAGTGDPVVGQRVFRSGSTTGLHDGQVTALNATVNYPEGTVTGLIQTTVCAEPGDRGPVVLRGHRARGDVGRQRGLPVGRHDVLPAADNGDVGARGAAHRAVRGFGGRDEPGARPPHRPPRPPRVRPSHPVRGLRGPRHPRAVQEVGTKGSFVTRLTDVRNVGPGLLVIAAVWSPWWPPATSARSTSATPTAGPTPAPGAELEGGRSPEAPGRSTGGRAVRAVRPSRRLGGIRGDRRPFHDEPLVLPPLVHVQHPAAAEPQGPISSLTSSAERSAAGSGVVGMA